MFKQFVKNLKTMQETPGVFLAGILLGFLLGFALVSTVVRFAGEATWICMGTAFALAMLVVICILSGFNYATGFMMSVSMGRTRREFLLTFVLQQLLCIMVSYLLIQVLYRAEMAAYTAMFPGVKNEAEFTFMASWWLPMMIPVLTLLSVFVGTLACRFGRKWVSILFFVFGWGFLGAGRLIEHGATWLANVPVAVWIGLAAAAVAAMAVTALRLAKTQMVH